jgi:hypothetical protein
MSKLFLILITAGAAGYLVYYFRPALGRWNQRRKEENLLRAKERRAREQEEKQEQARAELKVITDRAAVIKDELNEISAYLQRMGPRSDGYYFAYVTSLQLCKDQASLLGIEIRQVMSQHKIDEAPPELADLHGALLRGETDFVPSEKMPKTW